MAYKSFESYSWIFNCFQMLKIKPLQLCEAVNKHIESIKMLNKFNRLETLTNDRDRNQHTTNMMADTFPKAKRCK